MLTSQSLVPFGYHIFDPFYLIHPFPNPFLSGNYFSVWQTFSTVSVRPRLEQSFWMPYLHLVSCYHWADATKSKCIASLLIRLLLYVGIHTCMYTHFPQTWVLIELRKSIRKCWYAFTLMLTTYLICFCGLSHILVDRLLLIIFFVRYCLHAHHCQL